MPLWAWAVVLAAASLLLLSAIAWLLSRSLPPERKLLATRITRLPWRAKARLTWALLRDRRVPLWLRALVPALVLYLAMPLDIIPDFIPVVGYLDDVLLVAIAAGVLLRFAPLDVVEAHVAQLEVRKGA